MDDIDNAADGIFAQLPDWSKTSDPEAKLDYAALRAASVTFLHSAAEMRQYYRVSAQTLKDLKAVGLPSDVMTALGAIESGKIFKGEQLLSLLSQKLGRKLEPKNDLLILKYSEIWRSKVQKYSAAYCFPKLNQSKAAALYLFLRETPSTNRGRWKSGTTGGQPWSTASEDTSARVRRHRRV